MQAETERRPADANPTGTLVSGAAFIGFSAAHLIDEFLWNAPQEFHLREGTTLLLALLFVTALAGLLAGAALQRPTSTFGLALIGARIAVADVSQHAPEIAAAGPWRSGLISTSLAAGLTLSAALTAVFAFHTWWALRTQHWPAPLPHSSPSAAWTNLLRLRPGANAFSLPAIGRPARPHRRDQVDLST
jgi:hypothetical protein